MLNTLFLYSYFLVYSVFLKSDLHCRPGEITFPFFTSQ